MDEDSLKASIDTYQQQLEQVNQAIQAAGETQDLLALRQDLEELINLTQESLLSLRKSALLKQLDDADHTTEFDHPEVSAGSSGGALSNNSIDDEYAAFQAMLGDDVTQTNKDNSRQQESDSLNKSLSELYADVVGTKCRAPFVQSWGEKSYGNALIVGIEESLSEDEIPKVRVMFCNPTHQSMLPCKYFLDGECKFAEEKCRCSHGYLVALEELQEYEEPDYSSLKIESKCLACYEDDIWYKATVVDISKDTITVMFDSYEDEAVPLAVEDILPIEHVEESSDSEDDQPITEQDSEDDQDSLPVFLWKPPSHGLGDLGQWEAHTKGIGSKLLTKMGYEPGKGLGKAGEGRVLPVPIQLLPQGKSLDKIMKLKELAGDRDMFDAMKIVEKKMKKQAEKMEKAYEKKEKPNVFDFINTKLRGKKGSLSELLHKHEGQGQKGKGQGQGHRNHGKTISEHDLHKKSERSINIQLLKTSEEMKSVEKELDRLKQSLNRNENRDRNMASQVRSKIQSLELYRDQLKSSEQTMQTHQKKRSDHRKLTIF